MVNKKKILIISRAFYPMNSPRSFRTTELTKEFTKQNHDVTVMTPKNGSDHVQFEKEYGITIKDLGPLQFRHIDISKHNLWYWPKRILKRLLNLLFEYPDIELMYRVKKVLKYESGYDLLISIAVPHPIHWGVAWAYDTYGKIANTWVADCGDPYMMAIHDSFNKLFYFKYFEKWWGRKSDYIAITKNNFINNYYPEFHHKIVEIPQGFNFSDIAISKSKPRNCIPKFAFAGNFIKTNRNPQPFLEFLSDTEKEFEFHIYTRTKDLLLPYKSRLGDKLQIHNYIPRKELLPQLNEMDFLVNIGFDTAHQYPSKLIDYSIVGRPILSLDPNVIDKNMVNQFLSGNYTNSFKIPDLNQYRIENVCSKFLSLAE